MRFGVLHCIFPHRAGWASLAGPGIRRQKERNENCFVGSMSVLGSMMGINDQSRDGFGLNGEKVTAWIIRFDASPLKN